MLVSYFLGPAPPSGYPLLPGVLLNLSSVSNRTISFFQKFSILCSSFWIFSLRRWFYCRNTTSAGFLFTSTASWTLRACIYSISLWSFLFLSAYYLYFLRYEVAWPAIWYTTSLNWSTHLPSLHSCWQIMSRHSSSCFSVDLADLGLCSTSFSFSDMRTSGPFFLVEEVPTLSSKPDVTRPYLFLGVDNPEITSFFLFFYFQARPWGFSGL